MSQAVTRTPASFAVRAAETLGRVHADPADADRDPFELDRDRIVASTAFRRLQGKTQVFVYDEHDHFRTRLTHTLEVAQIARRLAVMLGVNESLAEVIALAHDLGHPPFGHAGEAALAECMADHGGFEHNAQSLRVVDYLEHPHPAFRGLNLTFECREGLIKHVSRYDRPDASTDDAGVGALFAVGPCPTLEAQLVSVADRIAYDCHDLEDALGAGLIGEADLAGVTLWRDACDAVRRRHPGANIHAVRRPVLDRIVSRLVTDCADATRSRLARCTTVDDVRRSSAAADFSVDLAPGVREIEEFLARRVYHHDRLVPMDARGRERIDALFDAYVRNPARLPPRFAARLDAQGVHRVVCDYIAGMTDRFCRDEARRGGG